MCGCFETGKCRRFGFAVPTALEWLAAALAVGKYSHCSKGPRDAQTGSNILQLDSALHWRVISVLITTMPLFILSSNLFRIVVGPQFQKPLTTIQALTCSAARLKSLRSILFFSDSANLSSMTGERSGKSGVPRKVQFQKSCSGSARPQICEHNLPIMRRRRNKPGTAHTGPSLSRSLTQSKAPLLCHSCHCQSSALFVQYIKVSMNRKYRNRAAGRLFGSPLKRSSRPSRC